jgi:hypothetical protein
VIVAVGPDVRGEQASRHIVGLVADRPELAGWDWIHDVRESSGEVGNPDVVQVAEAFAGADGPTWTIFVTYDRNFGLWCKVMDAQFGDRVHLTAPTLEAAIQELDARRGWTA